MSSESLYLLPFSDSTFCRELLSSVEYFPILSFLLSVRVVPRLVFFPSHWLSFTAAPSLLAQLQFFPLRRYFLSSFLSVKLVGGAPSFHSFGKLVCSVNYFIFSKKRIYLQRKEATQGLDDGNAFSENNLFFEAKLFYFTFSPMWMVCKQSGRVSK